MRSNIPKGSRLFAWVVLFTGVFLSAYLNEPMYYVTAIPAAAALYANKQYQDRKKDEINK